MNWGYLGFVGFKNLEIVQLGSRLWGISRRFKKIFRNSGGGGGGGLGETPGGAVEVVADEEGGGGLGSGRHQFGQWVLLENVVVF
uniref:Uncharacterized protein n=1 Tax=Fagus sylvatica TaxID=28930 RepID=A0A2N9EZ99_FAGSY